MDSVKAERTRRRLATVALGLFDRQGFDDTSVAQIAADAGVSEMTFFRYFPTKASVVLADPYDPAIGSAIAAQPSDLPALERAVRGIRTSWHELPQPHTDEVRMRIRIAAASPYLRAAMFQYSAETEKVIAEGIGGDRFVASIAASAIMAALNTALLQWSVDDDSSLGGAIDAALDVLVADRD